MPSIQIADRALSAREVQELLATDHPMIAQLRFEQTSGDGDDLGFALHIIPRGGVRYLQQRDSRGQRVRPAWRTLSGSEVVGQGNRSLWLEGDELVAENSTFFPQQEFNDLGIGSALYVAQERLYRALGVRRVTLLAVDVGVYVWARQGFAFLRPETLADMIPRLERFLFGHQAPLGFDAEALQQSWDLANLAIPDVAIDGYRAGKAFMLSAAGPWHGVKLLDDARHNAVAEASRKETFARLPDKIEGAGSDLAVR